MGFEPVAVDVQPFAHAITPHRFRFTGDNGPKEWNPGNLKHVVAALQQRPVIFHHGGRLNRVHIGAKLHEVIRDSRLPGQYGVIWEDIHGYKHLENFSDGVTGAVIPMDQCVTEDLELIAYNSWYAEAKAGWDAFVEAKNFESLRGPEWSRQRITVNVHLTWVDVKVWYTKDHDQKYIPEINYRHQL